jgi:23S rRNA pseudouridine1911/1915/1917 synthase
LIAEGLVTFNGKVLKPATKVHVGQSLQVQIPAAAPSTLQPYEFKLDILFEDDDCAVINKPAGLVVHPAAGHAQDTLVNALLYNVKNLSMGFHEARPGIVHRLDRDTSGILVIAKNDFAHEKLAAQFKQKSVHRVYWALVYGNPKPPKGTFRSYLARHPSHRKKFSSQSSGKMAITHYATIQNSARGVSWLRCQLETGRTHQIRVHLSEAKHSIVGDPIYGSTRMTNALSIELQKEIGSLKRIGLHARELGFIHPRTGKEMQFSIGWPEDLKNLVALLGFKDV